jgi:ribosomal protein S18 acetylase RimI-like enzyme
MIDVRRAGPGDAEELMRLRGVMLGGMHGVTEVGGDWQRAGAEILRVQLAEAESSLAAFVAGKPDGLAACVLGQVDQRLPGPRDPTGLRGYVYNVATDPAYRRRGLSRACMTALLEWFAARGTEVVDLRASPEGEPLYASLGFVRTTDPAMRFRTNLSGFSAAG